MKKYPYRGDIYWCHIAGRFSSEQCGIRPCVIVSNNTGNKVSTIVEVVPLSGADKQRLPTHVTVSHVPKTSTALCEQITTLSVERLREYIGQVSQTEMWEIEEAMLISLGMGGKI